MLRPLLCCLLLGCAEVVRATPALPLPLTPTGAPATAAETTPRVLGQVEIVAVGDIIPHESIKGVASRHDARGPDGQSTNHEGWDALFADVAPAIASADLAFANLETPIAPDSHKTLASKIFNGPPALLDALVGAGFDVLSFANNHVYDQGRSGFIETMDRLDKQPVQYIGAGRTCADASRARLVTKNDVTLAFIGSTRLHNAHLNRGKDEPCSFVLDAAVVAAEAKAAREAGADAVILSVHWGVEYETTPLRWDVDLAHKLLESGVDVLLGHHAHVLQPIEVYETKDGRTTFVIYSLGNFLSGQGLGYRYGLHPADGGNTRDGVLLRFKVVKTRHGDGSTRAWLADLGVEPLWSEPGSRSCLREPGVRAKVRPVINAVAAEQARALAQAEPDAKVKVSLERCASMYEDRRAHAASILGPAWLRGGSSAAAALAGVDG